MQKPDSGGTAVATHADITNILGNIDSDKLLAILSLRPTIAEVEEAWMWLSGDADVFGANEPVKGNASHIVTILTAEEKNRALVDLCLIAVAIGPIGETVMTLSRLAIRVAAGPRQRHLSPDENVDQPATSSSTKRPTSSTKCRLTKTRRSKGSKTQTGPNRPHSKQRFRVSTAATRCSSQKLRSRLKNLQPIASSSAMRSTICFFFAVEADGPAVLCSSSTTTGRMTPLRCATRWREAPIRAASEKDDDLYATKKRIEIGEIVPVLQDHLASSTYPAGRARLREALVVAEYIASRKSGGTDAEWEQLVHDIAVANRTIKSGA